MSTLEVLFKERIEFMGELLQFVSFALLPRELLKKIEASNLSQKIPFLNNLVNEALCYLESGMPKAGADQRFQHRRSSFKELQYICDGDSKGVMYFAGTSFSKHQWVNPVMARLMCNYYTLRQDSSMSYPRFWKLLERLRTETVIDLYLVVGVISGYAIVEVSFSCRVLWMGIVARTLECTRKTKPYVIQGSSPRAR